MRPLARSADGKLLAVNTPDNRLEVFAVQRGQLKALGSVMVGLEPVALALRSEGEVWVVNHLSELRELARRTPLTFTAVPNGSGERSGLDRDRDGTLDGDE